MEPRDMATVVADIRRIAAGYKGDYADDGRTRYLKAVEGMTFGDSRAQGVVRGRNFFHEDLGIALTAPQGWRIQNAQQAITVANAAGDAGLVVQLLPPKAGTTHDEIIRNVVKPTQGRSQPRTIHGLAATEFTGARLNAQGRSQPVRVLLVSGPANRNYLLFRGARDATALQRAASALAEAESSFRPLGAAERAAARPWTLKTAPYPRGGFAELARSSPLPLQAEAQLRLMNSAYGGGPEPRPGQPVKVVR